MKKLISLLSAAVMSVSVLSFPVIAESNSGYDINVYELVKGKDLDFNSDDNLNYVDYMMYFSYSITLDEIGLEVEMPTEYDKLIEKGDINKDGILDANDMSIVMTAVEGEMDDYLPGDVDLDGIITGADATLALSCYTQMLSGTSKNKIRNYDIITNYGDMDGDGKITGSDATMILQAYTDASSK